jgi:hypothetical protein
MKNKFSDASVYALAAATTVLGVLTVANSAGHWCVFSC